MRIFPRIRILKEVIAYCLYQLRHTSTTYKLRYSNGDIKSVQGDTGHANSQMVTDVYAEIVDEDRKYNAQRFEEDFYKPYQVLTKPEADNPELSAEDLTALLSTIKKNPELLQTINAMVSQDGQEAV